MVGLEDDRLRSAQGQVAYIKGLPTARAGERYLVVRPTVRYTRLDRTSMCCDLMHKDDLDERGRRDIDFDQYWTNVVMPDKGHELLGFELMRVNLGTVTRGEVGGIEASTLLLDEQGREVRVGDRLIAVDAQPYDLQFFPHPPKQQLRLRTARVLAVADMLSAGGPRDVVAISAGTREGVDNGTVFSIWREGSQHGRSRRGEVGPHRGFGVVREQGAPAGRVRRPRDDLPHLREGQLRPGDGQHQADQDRLPPQAPRRAVLKRGGPRGLSRHIDRDGALGRRLRWRRKLSR